MLVVNSIRCDMCTNDECTHAHLGLWATCTIWCNKNIYAVITIIIYDVEQTQKSYLSYVSIHTRAHMGKLLSTKPI